MWFIAANVVAAISQHPVMRLSRELTQQITPLSVVSSGFKF
jgi:hypothetical protein